MDATARFLHNVGAPDDQVDLAEGALALAAHAHRDLDIDAQRRRLDLLADGCADASVDGVRQLLFVDLGFTGRSDRYYAPENSFLDAVLDTRQGIPISLSVVVMEVGRRVGVPFVGIGMPGHFLARARDEPGRYLDAFHGGAELDRAGCEAVFRDLAGPKAPFAADYLAPVRPATILGRMVANLVHAYRRLEDRHGMRWSARLRAGCPDVGAGELLQLAQTLAITGALDEAAVLIDRALPVLGTDEADRWSAEAALLRARLN